MESSRDLFLLCDVDGRICAIPATDIVETMRSLPVEPLTGTPDCVAGVSIIRGAPVPVVDAAKLLGGVRARRGWIVVLKVGQRRVALAVDAVVGLRLVDEAEARDLPPLLRNAGTAMISALGALDSALMVSLETMRILPEPILAKLEADAVAA